MIFFTLLSWRKERNLFCRREKMGLFRMSKVLSEPRST